MKLDFVLVFAVVFTTMGFIQYAKGFLKDLPSWFWGLMLPAGCIVISAAFLFLPTFVVVALLAMALSQLGYENIIQVVKRWIQKSTGIPTDTPGAGA